MPNSTLQVKVSLAHIRPPVWRRLRVPSDISLARLHRVVQDAMGWQDYHLHVFETPDGDFGFPDPELGHRDENTTTLVAVAPNVGDRITYTYDFGDGWEHLIAVEKVLTDEPATAQPVCVTGRRACPPEDCGGPWGYGELLAALADPRHEQHDELTAWVSDTVGGSFDPEHLDIEEINQRFAAIR